MRWYVKHTSKTRLQLPKFSSFFFFYKKHSFDIIYGTSHTHTHTYCHVDIFSIYKNKMVTVSHHCTGNKRDTFRKQKSRKEAKNEKREKWKNNAKSVSIISSTNHKHNIFIFIYVSHTHRNISLWHIYARFNIWI